MHVKTFGETKEVMKKYPKAKTYKGKSLKLGAKKKEQTVKKSNG